jgi:hypothetical protein
MKRIPTRFFLLALPAILAMTAIGMAQSISVTPFKNNQHGNPGEIIETACKVENLTSNPITVRVVMTKKTATVPQGWDFSFCLINCYAPGVDSVDQELDPKVKADFDISWITNMTPGASYTEWTFTNLSNPSEKYTQTFSASTIVDGVDEKSVKPKALELSQNYPNPFSLAEAPAVVAIGYSVPRTGAVTVRIYNLLGREVRTLVNEVKSAGAYSANWDAHNNDGMQVSPGIYIYKLMSGSSTLSRRLVVTR